MRVTLKKGNFCGSERGCEDPLSSAVQEAGSRKQEAGSRKDRVVSVSAAVAAAAAAAAWPANLILVSTC